MEMMLRDPFHTKETLYCILRLPSFLLYAGACEHNKRVGKISRFADASCSLKHNTIGNPGEVPLLAKSSISRGPLVLHMWMIMMRKKFQFFLRSCSLLICIIRFLCVSFYFFWFIFFSASQRTHFFYHSSSQSASHSVSQPQRCQGETETVISWEGCSTDVRVFPHSSRSGTLENEFSKMEKTFCYFFSRSLHRYEIH